jgi:HD superfamily phosphohydrolase YqeK
MFLTELLKLSSYAYMKDEYKDYAYAAAIIHDTAKYGMTDEMDKSAYSAHEKNAAAMFEAFCLENEYQPHPFLLGAVRAHMGQWCADRDDKPFTNIDRVVHMADYIASRNFIDIPALHE